MTPINNIYVPETPGGTLLLHLEAETEEQAWLNLLEDARHMPYDGIQGFKERGYRVDEYAPVGADPAKPLSELRNHQECEHDDTYAG